MREQIGRLLDHLTIAPDAIARHVGADVEISAKRRDVRITRIGHADDRARLGVELAEAVEGAGMLLRQDCQIALDETISDTSRAPALAGAIIETRPMARKKLGPGGRLLQCRRNSHLCHLPNISTNSLNISHAIKSNLRF